MANDINAIMAWVDKTDDCWLWRGAIGTRGYGKVTVERKSLLVHRYVYSQLVCDIPDGMVLDHTCENKLCVNPNHLDIVTIGENIRRYKEKIDMCKHGHLLEGDNLYICPRGRRECRECRRQANVRYMEAKIG